jgi:type 1 glutamine amidotransferase
VDRLAGCDVALFFTRRLTVAGPQLDAVKAYCASGKPVVGVRTASHGFQNWLQMDREVFGGDYRNHWKAGPVCEVKLAGVDHPVLKGVTPFASPGNLYKNPQVAADVTVLLTGTAGGKTEPVAWVRERAVAGTRQRVVYTSLGHPDDFRQPAFVTLLTNGLTWAVGKPT